MYLSVWLLFPLVNGIMHMNKKDRTEQLGTDADWALAEPSFGTVVKRKTQRDT